MPACSTFRSGPRRSAGLLIVLLLAGCQRSGIEGETGTVTGTVTYQNAPIPTGSNVIFLHKQQGLVGTGTTDAAGEFTVQMRGSRRVLVGEYAIGITPPVPENPDAQNQASMEASLTGKDVETEAWTAIPQRYLMPETSGESYEVKAGSNVCTLKLTD
jgi:hypothetical protein